MTIGIELPQPRYPAPAQFGCAACRDAFGPDRFDDRTIPPPFVPVSQRLGRRTAAWTRRFHACRECDAIWLLAYSPKELTYEQTPTPLGMTRALRPEATLDEIMVPLFAPAPVGSATEGALWQLDYEPQELWDRLVGALRHPDAGVARQATILRQLGELLRPANPHHRERMRQRGWLLGDLHGIGADLDRLEAAMAQEDSRWQAFPDALQNLATLRRRIAADGVLRRAAGGARESKPPPVAPPVQPAAVTLAGRSPAATKHSLPPAESTAARTLQLLRPYWNYLPAIVLGWFLAELVPAGAPEDQRWMLRGFFLSFVLVATGTGATASAGISGVGLARTFVHRLSVIGEFLYVAVLAFLAIVAYVAVATAFDPGLSHPAHRYGVTVVALLPLVRLWPFLLIPFMQPVERDIKSAKQLGNYRRPALATAWRMTRQPGTFRQRTLPWFLAFGLTLGLSAAASALAGAVGRSLVLYPLALPVLTAFTWALIEPMPDREWS